MKSKVLKTSIGILIFLLIAASFIAAMKPVYSKVDGAIRSCEKKIVLELEKNTGMKISYKSLSPSILSKICIKGIDVLDSKSGQQIIFVNKIYVHFSLPKILKGDFENAFEKLLVKDACVNIDSKKNSAKTVSEKNNSAENSFEKVESLIKKIAFILPFDVQVKNFKLNFTAENKSFSLSLKNFYFGKNENAVDSWLKSEGNFLFYSGERSFGATFVLNGKILNSVSGSSCTVKLDNYYKADISLRKLEFLAAYKSPKIEILSVREVFPFSTMISFDVTSKKILAKLKSNSFDPLKIVRTQKLHPVVNFFKGTIFSTDSEFSFDLNSLKYNWKSKTFFSLPRRFAKGTQTLNVEASGNNIDINVKKLYASGGIVQGTFEGSFYIPKLQPSGYLNLEHYSFFNGNKISAEIFFEPRKDKGFDFFIPQLYFGDYSCYTAFQGYSSLGMSIELAFEASDYSHLEYGEPGRINASGSLQLGKNMYLQASAELKNFFVETGVKTGAFFTEKNGRNVLNKVVKISEPYISNVEAYFATDFKDYNYNSPLAIFANTKKDKEVLLLSVDGTGGKAGTSVQVSKADLIYGKNSLSASGGLDVEFPKHQMTFSSDFTFNSIPYAFNGLFVFGDWLNISGDYGLDVAVDFKNFIDGSLRFKDLPVSVNDFMLAFSLDSNFSVLSKYDWNFFVENFSASELSGKFRLKPELTIKGEVNEKSFLASSVVYKDSFAQLEGEGYAFWNINEKIFDSSTLSVQLKDSKSSEKISFQAELTNPTREIFSVDNLKRDFYFSAGTKVEAFPFSRFLLRQNESNVLNAELSASGTFENPYLSAKLIDSSVLLGGSNLTASAEASLIENTFTISSADISWKNFQIDSVSSNIDFETFSGTASLKAKAHAGEKKIETGIELVLSNLSENLEGFFPEAYSVETTFASVESELVADFVPFKFSVIRSPGRFDIVTDENLGAFGEILDDGKISFSVAKDKPLYFDLNGNIKKQIVDLDFENIFWDVSRCARIFNSKVFSIYSAIVEGNLNLSGSITDPDMDGRFVISDVDFNLPQFVPEHFTTAEMNVDFSQEEISIPETNFKIKDGILAANAVVSLDRWSLGTLELNLATLEDEDIPIDSKVSYFRIKGYTSVDASLIMEDRSVSLNGSVGLQNAELSVSMNASDFTQKKKPVASNDIDFSINLDLMIGKKVQIAINPLVRSLVAPSTPISVNADTATGLWGIKGDIVLRGGEVSYLSRNFYLKQGQLILDETQNKFDPVITVRAETREHDTNGDPVTITLSAISQNISRFNAVLSSSPAKSESEIMEILGQIASGDASSVGNFLVAAGDYGVQVTLLRKIESALRDLSNFDIFSVRTTILQNSIMQGLNMNRASDNNSIIGNLFDNSTVYIGKYFGDDIYADALLHWTYDKTKLDSGGTSGNGLVFQPEIGLEFEAPFANIRWNFAPDLGELQQSWTQATSITLSWRVSF